MPPADLKVLISGGGIAGLTLAVLLERAGIDYEVFERASIVRPLGSALSIGPSVLPMIEQLGLMEKFQEVSKVNGVICNFNEDLHLTSTVIYTELHGR
jgi:2-polyprenyl-6-methoxyphenol hydroxylase-like FAD-dependent oxidoreductase